MIRAFVAIAVPEALHPILEAGQSGLPTGRIVVSENFHITLAFLDSQPEAVLADLDAHLARIAMAPFPIAIEGLGTFGDARPRALFADVPPTPPLSRLRNAVRGAAREAGITLEHKRFHPHVTLARFGAGLTGEAIPALQAHIAKRMGQIHGQFTVEGFTLYESHLTHDGPIYTPLADYALAPDTETPPGKAAPAA